MQDVIKRIYDYSLEDIMGERFGRYAKTIIQDRALPDARDGLKPVQRRILYAMYTSHNTYDKPYRKSAKTVGDVMGQYHPHGDSSIYEAMVRMSQWWKQSTTYIDMHGNNGSMDGDGAAAMRYTEARLSKISNELLKDINKDTVLMTFNYDDTLYEPTVLPAKFPNLLVNGSTGISAGYATNIPPHNLGEVIDATIKRIDSPNCQFDTILDIIKGPDFPTGAIACGRQGIIDAFKTGRGKVIVKSKYEVVKNKGKDQIIISEIPFEVNKAALVKKIDEIRIDKKIEGIAEVRDESDLENPETIVIDLKKDADSNLIVNYLLKNTDMQVSYNYNMVAIVNHRPVTLGVIEILDAYIAHQKEVILRRTKFDLDRAKAEMHIVEGLIKALSILDEVIKTIRGSKNKADAKENLVKLYDFTEKQAEAIVMLQLYKLTNTDVTELMERKDSLVALIKELDEILNDENKLKSVMKDELRSVKKEYATPRKTEILDEVEDIKIDTTKMIPKEDCIVVVTNEGYVKRVSLRSYSASDDETLVKEGDYVIGLYELNTLDTVLLFTNLGNYLYVPVHEIPDLKWKELGKHISNIIKIDSGEVIVSSIPVTNFDINKYITTFSKDGLVKRTKLSEFKASRYSKPMGCMKLKGNDIVIEATINDGNEVFITTKRGYALRYNVDEISIIGLKGSGVKSIALKDDEVVSANIFNSTDYVTVITKNGTGKRIKLSEFEVSTRARRGILLVRDVKTNPYSILKTFITDNKNLSIVIKNDITKMKSTELPIVDRLSTGTVISKKGIDDCFMNCNLVKREENNNTVEKEEIVIDMEEEIIDIPLDIIDEQILTIDDFLDDFEI
ncbi:MAG: DNA topoisomerase IV subunit A [Firmicutes bacterium]|nr:DNA topoisomerase IV subunit A [Bacillota bacterium]